MDKFLVSSLENLEFRAHHPMEFAYSYAYSRLDSLKILEHLLGAQ